MNILVKSDRGSRVLTLYMWTDKGQLADAKNSPTGLGYDERAFHDLMQHVLF